MSAAPKRSKYAPSLDEEATGPRSWAEYEAARATAECPPHDWTTTGSRHVCRRCEASLPADKNRSKLRHLPLPSKPNYSPIP